MEKQVESKHYEFLRYMTKARWNSIWHQLDEIIRLDPKNVLEIGPGPGVLKKMLSIFGVNVDTLDLDSALVPDYVGSATNLPFADNTYDLVCAFQMLEHIPYEKSLQAFAEMARVSRRNLVISLPDAEIIWKYHFHIPKLGGRDVLVPRPGFGPKSHVFDGEHYWEINKKRYELSRVSDDMEEYAKLVKTYRVPENLHHRFFIFDSALSSS
jgi:ubiquinone/menaquinone biosynthesis C-methylase UbiE